METISFEPDFTNWQKVTRGVLARGLPPEEVLWRPNTSGGGSTQADLSLSSEISADNPIRTAKAGGDTPGRFRVPREFLSTARFVACHREPDRWDLLYRILWRLTHGEPHLLEVATDPDVIHLGRKAKDVRQDVHKMRAFVRFREVRDVGRSWYVAWFEPRHSIVELNAPFFVERFASMNWSILTPDRCAHWDGKALTFTEGVSRNAAPSFDATEDLWRTYYRHIFNPARIKVSAMKKEMAPYYWKNLPETELIPDLLAEAPLRASEMIARSEVKKMPAIETTAAPVPASADWNVVRDAASICRACPLWRNATCTVFGEGPLNASVVVIGEQPGDQEDRAGRPFVGPAGKLLDRSFTEAGVDRSKLYLTNAVKHFKWEPRGKRRLHQKPNPREVAACRPWLEKEVSLVRPALLVCLGSTAAQAVVGAGIKITEERGRIVPSIFDIPALITVHPSSLLRQPDRARSEIDSAAFVEDLKQLTSSL